METRELKNKLEGAGNHLTKSIVRYWSQNKHLQLRFDVRPASPKDPDGMQTGTNIWGDVFDTSHMVTTELGSRSRGFVWFFSFLAWYHAVKDQGNEIILLLDEPGLSLHGRAQEDLLRYFDAEILGNNQLIYTTHSPFLVDSKNFERVRIVQDLSVDADDPLPPEQEGTKVFTDVLEATQDSLFPLQGALGYEIYQTLFVGPNCLVVEGISDLVYLNVLSSVLEGLGRVGLDKKWTITPVGGADNVPTFVSLLGSQSGVKLAVLVDLERHHKQMVENLYKRKLLQKKNVLTYSAFTSTKEADVEDMFERTEFLGFVNTEYTKELNKPIAVGDLGHHPRVMQCIEDLLKTSPLKSGGTVSHFRPARYLSEHVAATSKTISPATLDRFEDAFKRLNGLL